MIEEETQVNEIYSRLYEIIKVGWPNKDQLPDDLKQFFKYRDSLDVQSGCIFYENRIFVPSKCKDLTLKLLHKEHEGIVECKQAARESVWWPAIDKDIELYVNDFATCQVLSSNRNGSKTIPWPATNFPMERIHMDHFFFKNKIFRRFKIFFSSSPSYALFTEIT